MEDEEGEVGEREVDAEPSSLAQGAAGRNADVCTASLVTTSRSLPGEGRGASLPYNT